MLVENKTLKKTAILIVSLFALISQSLHALEPKVILANGLEFWTESFGNKKNPAVLLIMGTGGQGLLWPQAFCEALADKGFYVIRYDNRDTGLSSSIDFKQSPYTILNLAKDAITILDSYKIQKANIVGGSMGGEVGVILAANYPSRVASLTLFSTTTDMKPAMEAFLGLPTTDNTLSPPKPAILEGVKKMVKPPKTLEEKLNNFMKGVALNAGSKVPVDKALMRQLGLQSFVRMLNPDGAANHFAAVIASYQLHQDAIPKVKAPTVILHGDQDPVFGMDHALALHKAIPQSKLIVIPGMGHGVTNPQFYKPAIEGILEVAQ